MVDARLFQALSDPTRLKILLLLSRSTMNVTSIVNEVKAAQPAVSRHLRVLREASLINHVRKGKEVEYSLNHPQLRDAKLYIEALAGGTGEGAGPEIVEVAVPAAKPGAREVKAASAHATDSAPEPAGKTWAIPKSASSAGGGRGRRRKSSGPGIMGRSGGKSSAGRRSGGSKAAPESSGKRLDREGPGGGRPAGENESAGRTPAKPEPVSAASEYVVEREEAEAMDDFLL